MDGCRPRSSGSPCSEETTPVMPPKTIADRNGGLRGVSNKTGPHVPAHIRSEVPVSLYLPHDDPNAKCTVDLTILHQVTPYDALVVIALVDVLGQVESDSPQQILIIVTTRREFLDNIKMYLAVMKALIAVDGEPDLQCPLVMPRCSVVQDDCLICTPMVFGRIRRRKTPFYKRRSTHKWNIV